MRSRHVQPNTIHEDQDQEMARTLARLEEDTQVVDALWHQSCRSPTSDVSLQLGEASLALHRALVALARQ
jgi:hypothetical protein